MRTMWFLAGAGASAYAMVKARRAAEILTPEGLGDRVAGLSVGWRILGEEVRTGMAERETELRRRLLVGLDEDRLLAAAPSREGAQGRHRRITVGAEDGPATTTSEGVEEH